MSTPLTPLTPAELAVRRPVWDALGELFLDTDTRPGLPLIARALAESGLGEAELNEIWTGEITPTLLFNLSVVAGEWAYFDADWVEERIVRRRAVRHRLGRWSLSGVMQRCWSSEMDPHYAAVMSLRTRLLALPERERPARAEAWHGLARAYFWPEWLRLGAAQPLSSQPLEALWAELEPVLRPLLMASENAGQRRQAVLERLTQAG